MLLLAVVLFSGIQTRASINPLYNFKGRITDATNVPVADGVYNFNFGLFTAPTGGASIWSESLNAANLFSATISSSVVNADNIVYTYAGAANTNTLRVGQPLNSGSSTATIIDFNTGANTVTVTLHGAAWANGASINNRPRVDGGIADINLGAVTDPSNVNFDQPLYLEITFNGETMLPRKNIVGVPQAFNAAKVGGRSASDFADVNASTTVNGLWNFANSLSISTSSANSVLSVNQDGAGRIAEFKNGGLDVLSILANGNVGIGTSTPSSMLTVGGTAGSQFLVNTTGAVTAGTWNGGVIGVDYGGTGNSFYTAGSILYASGTTTLTQLPLGSIGQVLAVSASNTPYWTAAGGGPGHDAVTFAGAYSYLSLNNQQITLNAINLGSDTTGILSISSGGTGTSTAPTIGQILIGDGVGGYNLVATSTLGLAAAGHDHAGVYEPSFSRLSLAKGGLATSTVAFDGLVKISGGITSYITDDSANWNTAYGWGNHATYGYITSSSSETLTNKTWNGNVIGVAYGGTGASTTLGQGSIVIAGAGGVYTQDIGFFWDSASNRLGLGETSPDAALDIKSSVATHTSIIIGNYAVGAWDANIKFETTLEDFPTFTVGVDASDFAFKISESDTLGTADRLVVASGGNIGIGTSTAPYLLTVGTTQSQQFMVNDTGQVVAGTWQGSPIGAVYGGTGTSSAGWTGYAFVNGGTWSATSSIPSGSLPGNLVYQGDDITWLTNNAGYITSSSAETLVNKTWNGSIIDLAYGGLATNTSAFDGLIKISGGITSYITDSSANWNTAYGWGNHATFGYITSSSAETLSNKSGNISMWTNDSGYLLPASIANFITSSSAETLTNKTWNGNVIDVAYGGTGTSTQFTPGSIVFAGANGIYSQDNGNIFWDDTNKRLGLGTAIPAYSLDVIGTLTSTSSDQALSRFKVYPNPGGNSGVKYFSSINEVEPLGPFNIYELFGSYNSIDTTALGGSTTNAYGSYNYINRVNGGIANMFGGYNYLDNTNSGGTNGADNMYGQFNYVYSSNTFKAPALMAGTYNVPITNGGIATDIVGSYNFPWVSGGTAVSVYGSRNTPFLSGVTAINAYGSYNSVTRSGGGLTNAYGVYIGDIAGQASNPWALYATGTASSYFGGNLGVGSTTPLARLTVKGSAGASPLFDVSSSTNASLFRINSDGNVGIGNISPSTKLEVVGDITSKGTYWTARSGGPTSQWQSVAYGDGRFVVVADWTLAGTQAMVSSDGINWKAYATPNANSWRSVTYGNGLFVAVSVDGSGNRVMTSPDGITWTSRTSAADNLWQSVTYGNGLFVAVAASGATSTRVMTSPDGINWTSRTAAVSNSWSSITYGNGLFVAVSINGSGNRVMTSPDGITWTSRTSAADNQWRSVTYGNGLFVAVSVDGTGNRVMTSPDGINWTSRTSAVDNQWRSVTYGNGLFVAVSADGSGNSVMTSPDGINWTSRTSAVDNFWQSVAYGNGTFVAVSQDFVVNNIMTSGKVESNHLFANNTYQGGMNIFGNVGIGTSTPSAVLTVGATSSQQFLVNNVGQVTAGTWQGSPIGVAYGGTGTSSAGWTGYAFVNGGVWSATSSIPSGSLPGNLIYQGDDITWLVNNAGYITSSSAETLVNKIWNGSIIDLAYGGLATNTSAFDGLIKISGGITSYITDSSANWNTAYGWGNHATYGYITSSSAETLTNKTWNGNVIDVAYGGTGTSTQFTPGSIVFAGANGVYSQNNSKLFWDNANGRLGVNTSTPGASFDVHSIITATTSIGSNNWMSINPVATGTDFYIGYNQADLLGSQTTNNLYLQYNKAHSDNFSGLVNAAYGTYNDLARVYGQIKALYGNYNKLDSSNSGAQSDNFFGSYNFMTSGQSFGFMNNLVGNYNYIYNQLGTVTTSAGMINVLYNNDTIQSMYGVDNTLNNYYTANAIYGTRNTISNVGGTVGSAYGLYSKITKSGGTQSNAYGLYIDDVQATNPWAIYSSSTVQSYLGGNLGVGSTTPLARLTVKGSAGASPLFDVSSSTNASLFRINSNGNVGIGTTTPGYSLDVKGSIGMSSLANPTLASSLSGFGSVRAIAVSGRYAYIAEDTNNSLFVVDISRPTAPAIVGSTSLPGFATELDEPKDVKIVGKYAYVLAAFDLTVVDISNPSKPQIVSSLGGLDTWSYTGGSFVVSGNYGYVADSGNSQIVVIDISNPLQLKIVKTLVDSSYLSNVTALAVKADYLYSLSRGSQYLSVIDIADPHNPVLVGKLTSTNFPSLNANAGSLAVSNNYAYVANFDSDRFTVVNISSSTNPVVSGTITNATLDGVIAISLAGKYAYVTTGNNDGLIVLDVSNPASPSIVASALDATNLNYVTNISVVGKYAYCGAQAGSRLTIMDISGVDVPTESVGALYASMMNVGDNAAVGNNLLVQGGVNIGGNLALYGESSFNEHAYFVNSISIGAATSSSMLTVGATSSQQFLVNNLGVVTGGTWQGSAIGATYGGFGTTTASWTGLAMANAGVWSATSSLGLSYGGLGADVSAYDGLIKVSGGIASAVIDNSANWNTAYGWGNHATFGYITSSSAETLTNKSGSISMWTNDSGYLLPASIANFITSSSAETLTNKAWNGNVIDVAYGGTGTSTQFTSGSIVYAGTNGVYEQDNANFFWDSLNKRLGIGTNAPSYGLQVAGGAKANNFYLPSYSNIGGTSTIGADLALGGYNGSLYWGRSKVTSDIFDENLYNFGQTWKAGATWKYWTGLAMSADGSRQTGVASTSQIYISTNFGSTWTAKLSNSYWSGVAMSADGSRQTAVADTDQIYISTDYGNTWSAKDSSRAWTAVAMSADGSRQTAVANADQIYISTDYGNTWSAKDSSRAWTAVAMSADGSRQTAVADTDQIYISTDYGDTWSAKDSSRAWTAVAMSADGSRQTAVASSSQIYVSTDYGDTWSAKDSSRAWTAVAMSADGSRQTATVYNGQIYTSTDSGNTWIARDSNRTWISLAMSADGSRQTAGLNSGVTYTSVTEKANYSGNVGIGTNAPTTQLHVAGLYSPTVVGSTTAGTQSMDINVQGRYAYVPDENSNILQVFDVSNPLAPVLVSSTPTNSGPRRVVVEGRYAYVINNTASTLQIYDISNPYNMTRVSTTTVATNPVKIVISGRYAYVAGGTSGGNLQIIDISDPAKPVVTGTIQAMASYWARSIAVQGRYAYLVASNGSDSKLKTFDISNPASPIALTSTTTGATDDVYDIKVKGRYVYILVNWPSSLKVYDISNPSNPLPVSSRSAGSWPGVFDIQGRYAYVAGESSDMTIIDISNPSSLSSVGGAAISSNFRGIHVQGRYAYTVGWEGKLSVIDLGGAYIQQLEVGGIEMTRGDVLGNFSVNGNLDVADGISIGIGGINSAGSLAVNNTAYFAGNVGIGTTSPSAMLTVGATSSQQFLVNNLGVVTGGTWQGNAIGVAYGGTGTSTAFTAGSIVFAGTGGAYSQDNANLFWDNTNARLGIGSSSPLATLSVKGQAGNAPLFDISSSTNSSLFRVNANGNVGIGDNTPDSLFDVLSSGAADTLVKIANTNAGNYDAVMQFELTEGSPLFSMGIDDSDSDKFKISGSGTLGTSDRLVIDSNGYVGIGTSSPAAMLDVTVTASSSAVIGSEMITAAADRDFSSDTGKWTGASWSIVGGVATHTASANPFTLNNTALSAVPAAGKFYQVSFDITTATSGGLTMNFGGITGRTIGRQVSSESQVMVVAAGSAGPLNFGADSSWVGSLDNISVKEITLSRAGQLVRNSDSSIGLEIRAGGAGLSNSFVGLNAGRTNITGNNNSAFGNWALKDNTVGSYNSAFGQALQNNTTGIENSAFGAAALLGNTTGSGNSAFGRSSLYNNTTGYSNSAFGNWSLLNNTTGYNNSAFGLSLNNNTTGSYNNALGRALNSNKTGSYNLGLGYGADVLAIDLTNATAIGYNAKVGTSNAMVLGGTGAYAVKVGVGTANPESLLHVVGAGTQMLLDNGLVRAGLAMGTDGTFVVSSLAASSTLVDSFEGTFPGSGWTTGGVSWATTSATSSQAVNSVTSGIITDSQSSWLDLDYTFPSAGYLVFDWQVSSEIDYDYLFVCYDNDACTQADAYASISGEAGWVEVKIPVTAGNHSIRWIYEKDESTTGGSDHGWVDNVRFTEQVTGNVGFNAVALGIGTTSPSAMLTVGATPSQQFLVNNLGVVTGGTWQGSAIGATYGGFGTTTAGWTGLAMANAGVWSATSSLSLSYGGLGADVSAYDGLIKVSGGIASAVTDNSANWNTAYGWGNHATFGYITSSSAETLTNKSGSISMWTNDSGYLLPASIANFITSSSAETLTNKTWNGNVIDVAFGGTGTSTTPTNGQLLIGNGTSYSLAGLTAGSGIGVTNGAGSISIANLGVTSVSGTAAQIIVSQATGSIQFSLPQDIANTSNPTFAGINLSGLTSGSLLFAAGGGAISQDNNNLYYDSTNYRLGIGTTNPLNSLDIFGAGKGLRLSYDGTHFVDLSSSADGNLSISSSASSSESALIVGSGLAQDAYMLLKGSSTNYYVGLDATDDIFKIGYGTLVGTATALSINSSGYLGIGTTSSNFQLALGDQDLGGGAAGPVLYLGRNNNTTSSAGSINFVANNGTSGYVWQDAAGNLRINGSAPTSTSDTAGTVVGSQASRREYKQDIIDFTDYNGALEQIIGAPLHYFRYKNEVAGYGEDSPLAKPHLGFIADEVSSDFMSGNVIDQVSVNGLLMASVKALDGNLDNLRDAFRINQDGTVTLGSDKNEQPATSTAEIQVVTATTSVKTAFVVSQAGAGDVADFKAQDVSVMTITDNTEVKVVGTLDVNGRVLVCAGGVCPADLRNNIDETMGDMGVEGKIIAGSFQGYCEDGFVWVPGSAKYGTMPGFCVMSDLAQRVGTSTVPAVANGELWNNISQGESQLACQSLGSSYHLLSENEWLTLAENISRTATNDTDKDAIGLQLATASTTYVLSNGNMIYNLAGVMTEWTDQTVLKAGLPAISDGLNVNDWQEYSSVVDYKGMSIAPAYYLSSANGIGKILTSDNAESLRGFIRGYLGVYSLDVSNAPTAAKADVGFRCAK